MEENMRNIELERDIYDVLYIVCHVNYFDLEDLLEKELEDFTYEEIDNLTHQIVDMVDDEIDSIRDTIASVIADQIQARIDEKHIHKYPEDAPGQLHLFNEEK